MKTFSAMWTDELGEAIKSASVEPYPVEFHNGEDLRAIIKAVNQGIDAHLEAIFFTEAQGSFGRVKITFEAQSVHTLVRRLMESDDDAAMSLASAICDTLGIELV